jgi:hypothetical protein
MAKKKESEEEEIPSTTTTTGVRHYKFELTEEVDDDLIDYLDTVDDVPQAIYSLLNLGRVVQIAGSFAPSNVAINSLFSKLDDRLDSFGATLSAFQGKANQSGSIGTMAEEIVLNQFTTQFTKEGDTFSVESTSSQNMDVEATLQLDTPTGPHAEGVRIEVKQYSKAVSSAEVEKFWRDHRQRPTKYAMFVSMTSSITGKENIAVEVREGKLAIFVANEHHDQRRHIVAWELLRHIVRTDLNTSSLATSISPTVRSLISNLSGQLDVISETKSHIGSLLETATKLQSNTSERVSELLQIHARSIALLDQYERNVRDLIQGTSDEYKQARLEYTNWKDDVYLPMMEHFTEQNQVVLSSFEQSIRDLSTITEYTVEPDGKFMEFQLNDTGEKIAKIENQGKKVKITFFKDLSGVESFERAGAKLSSSNTVFELENAPGKLASHPIQAVRELFSELVAPKMVEPEESTTEISTEKTD